MQPYNFPAIVSWYPASAGAKTTNKEWTMQPEDQEADDGEVALWRKSPVTQRIARMLRERRVSHVEEMVKMVISGRADASVNVRAGGVQELDVLLAILAPKVQP